MEIRNVGPLRARIVEAASAPTDSARLTCVLLHGFGAPGDDLVGLADSLDAAENTTFVFPEAHHALADFLPPDAFAGDGRAWWMIDMAAVERAIMRGEVRDMSKQVPEGLAEARAALASMLDTLAKERPGERLVLGGFSQGAMLALDVALHQPERPIAGLVLLSGTLLAEHEWAPRMRARAGTPVFQSHGRGDPILPFSVAERLSRLLTDAGLDVTFDPFAGPHTIPLDVLRKLDRWLNLRSGQTRP